MPGLVPGIHVFVAQDVDGRDKPGHDDDWNISVRFLERRSL